MCIIIGDVIVQSIYRTLSFTLDMSKSPKTNIYVIKKWKKMLSFFNFLNQIQRFI